MAGRPAGSKNRRSLKVEQIASKFDLDPFEVLMMITVGDWKGLGFNEKTRTVFSPQGIEMEEDNVPMAQRCIAAREASKYLHTQKHSIKHEISELEFKQMVLEKIMVISPKLIGPGND